VRVLMLSPYPIYAGLIGGKIRIIRLADHLAALGVEVTIATPLKPGAASPFAADSGITVRPVPYPFLFHHLLTDRPLPYQVLVSYHPGYRWLLRRAVGDFGSYDIVQFDHASFADLVETVPTSIPIVYSSHNVEVDYVASECRGARTRAMAVQRTRSLESRLLARADLTVTCCEGDARRYEESFDVRREKLAVIPQGLRDVAGPDPDGVRDLRRRLTGIESYAVVALYSGSNVEHNREAVRFIAKTLAPGLLGRCAFVIVGGCARALPRHPGENVFADADATSITNHAALSTLAIHPVIQGAGTNLKVLDALAHGLPVVSTPFGARGYADLAPFMVIRKREEFAGAILSKPHLSDEVTPLLEGRRWSVLARKLLGLYEELVSRASAP
jgi:Glycosyltransferase Family 4/Glycosyl transferases group 1